ncbi:MAG: elongation factor G [Betaproteobacteria bacterium RIFCSPLOWO2_12_FULL_62_13]|nr:MAG: elongation factor G [Betaproteobacteria bacterium RIFCSPLOWO2_12_FULL_62_13]
MSKFSPEAIRTIALIGHGAAGKTTLAEALLHKAGVIGAMGSVERGSTVCDFDPLEKSYQHSLNAALVHLEHRETRIHLIDTPGLPDFIGRAIGALPAVETVAVVINAQNGIEMITHRMMHWAAKRNLCRMIIVNKIDAENLDLPGLLAKIQAAFGKECLPINLPADGATRVVDCFFNPSGDSDFSSVEAAHQALVDQVVEVDEELMAKYLEQGEVSPEQLHEPFEKALREGHLIPVCFASGRSGAGVGELLDIFVRLMPNPTEGNPPQFLKGEGADAVPIRAEPDPGKHVLAHVFKVVIDPFVGKVGGFRVHQGTITKDTQLFVGDGRKPFKVGHLFLLQGKEFVETDAVVPGDLGAVAKVDDIHFDAVLHDSHEDDYIHLVPLEFPTPMHSLAIEPKRRGDEQRISEALHKLAAEDPTFKVTHNAASNETVISGLGDLHMRYILDKMANQYHVEVSTQPPRIPYRETITAKAEGHHRHKKQTGGAGQFGEVFLRVEPLKRGTGFEFVDQVKGGTIPTQFIPAVEKGVRQVLEAGPVAGFPVHDVRVIVYDGKHHPVDSKEVAFISAGKRAFMDAISKARPIILEPIVNIEITAPEANMGDIAGDISSKRGQISGTDSLQAGTLSITGQAPLSELNNYQARLKSVTAGQGSFTIELSHYEPVPPNVQKELAAQYAKTAHAEEQ